jgi:hypothetical protein
VCKEPSDDFVLVVNVSLPVLHPAVSHDVTDIPLFQEPFQELLENLLHCPLFLRLDLEHVSKVPQTGDSLNSGEEV